MHAASVTAAGRNVIRVLPFARGSACASAPPAAEVAAFSPGAALKAGVQLDPWPVPLWVSVKQHVRGPRLLLHQLLAMQRGTTRRHRCQTRHMVL